MNYTLVQTRTGKVHAAAKGTYNATPCNSRNKGFRVKAISAKQAKEVSPEHFCTKCFPKGKPSEETISAMATC